MLLFEPLAHLVEEAALFGGEAGEAASRDLVEHTVHFLQRLGVGELQAVLAAGGGLAEGRLRPRPPAEADGVIDIALTRRDETRVWWMKADPHGLPSKTTWKVMWRGPGLAWLALATAVALAAASTVAVAETPRVLSKDEILAAMRQSQGYELTATANGPRAT